MNHLLSVYPPGNIVTIHILDYKIISDTCNLNEYTGALMHWYVDVDQLPLERWCIYNDSVYRVFQLEKDGFGRELINVNFLHFYSFNFLLLLFDLLYMCQTNSQYLRITTRALTITTSSIPPVTRKCKSKSHFYIPIYSRINRMVAIHQHDQVFHHICPRKEQSSQRHLTES